MTANQICATILLLVYVVLHKAMPPMDFNNANFVVPFIATLVIWWIIVVKLVK